MPQQVTAGTEATKVWQGVTYTVRIESFDPMLVSVVNESTLNRLTYTSMTAAAQGVRGNTSAVNGWDFFGLVNPNRRTITRTRADGTTEEVVVKITGKCRHEGCYEPAACKHGLCPDHCQNHSRSSYSSRQYPRSPAPHMGIEVEVVYPDAHSFRRGVGIEHCHSDGSLPTYGAEYKLLVKSTVAAAEAASLVKEIWTRRGRVDRTCGLHVHLDARQLITSRRNELIDWLRRTQDIWFSLVPPSRRSNHFVQRLNGGGSLQDRGHYAWAHVSDYDTIEIRLHGGTLNPYKIAGWITALKHVQDWALDATKHFPNTGDAETDFWSLFADCPAEGKEYLATRKATGGVLRDRAFGHIEE